jgi:hypothetical protein
LIAGAESSSAGLHDRRCVVTFGAVEALGLMSLFVILAAAAYTAKWALGAGSGGKAARRIANKLDDFEEREEINRLRHRDFAAFLAKLNERRARLGQPALTAEYLEPHQFNLMYSVDASDIDEAELDKLRKRVGKAVKQGDEPQMEKGKVET